MDISTFAAFTLASLNLAIKELLTVLNNRAFKKLPGSRSSQFEALDKPALQRLPRQPYHYVELKLALVNIDYHVEFDKRYYSVPHHLVKCKVEIQASQDGIAIFFANKQVARHGRSAILGSFSTIPEHMPEAHQKHQQWTPVRLVSWGRKIGPHTAQFVQQLIDRKKHPEQAYRACLGLLNLSRKYDAQSLENACHRAATISSPNLRSVKSILKNGLDRAPLPDAENSTKDTQLSLINDHPNIRGSQYYH